MPIHYSFPSIEQLRHTVKHVRDRSNFHTIPCPTLVFHGTVKLHGTNAGIVRDLATNETWAQSRERLIVPGDDNAGFARFVQDNSTVINALFETAVKVFGKHCFWPGDKLAIYGEWCGQGIMKGVAINQLPKMFVVFGVKVIRDDHSQWFTPEEIKRTVNETPNVVETRIFCIENFPTFDIAIDFNDPSAAQAKLIELTTAVENECPVAKQFGVSGIGEGIVWNCYKAIGVPFRLDDLTFKVKGEKHSDTKVKTLAAVDLEKVASINAFVDLVITDHRLEKMVELTKAEGPLEMKSIPIFLGHVGRDVIKEESDTLDASGLDRKEVMGAVNRRARDWFLKMMKEAPL